MLIFLQILLLFKGCWEKLNEEIVPQSTPVMASGEYRKSLAFALFYKVCSISETTRRKW